MYIREFNKLEVIQKKGRLLMSRLDAHDRWDYICSMSPCQLPASKEHHVARESVGTVHVIIIIRRRRIINNSNNNIRLFFIITKEGKPS